MAARLRDWVLDRSGITTENLAALDKPLPKGVGWWNTLGSSAMLVLLVQAVTGMFLALYYSPIPGGAYLSVRYIDEHVPFGALVRGIHHYGASAAVVLVVVHMLRAYFHAAYKPPRELLWLLGIILLQIVLGFGFTGYLLPWDQKAYWATVVGTEIPASIPFVGPALRTIARGGSEIGAVTLTHFYAVHVLLLPALLFPTMGLHLLLVWKKGPTPPGKRVGEQAPTSSRFIQHQAFKDAVAMGVVFGVVYLLAILRPPELEFIANPADPSYTPRPDWYFLFLFQLLKDVGAIAPRVPEWIPAVVLPGLAITVLALMPWLDRSRERHWAKRPFWTGMMVVGIAMVVLLTWRAMAHPPENITPRNAASTTRFPRALTGADRTAIARGQVVFETEAKPLACVVCHKIDGKGGESAPPLDGIGTRRTYEWLVGHTREPAKYIKDSAMPPYPPDTLSDADLRAVTDYMVRPQPSKPVIIYQNP